MHAGIWGGILGGLDLNCDALTFPGHGVGDSALLPSIEQMGAWLSRELDSHKPQSVVLMGHSMGALAALEAARHPSVAALVLMGAAARMPVHPEMLAQAKEDPDTAVDMILKWGVSPVHEQVFAVRNMIKAMMAQAGASALLNDLTACNAYARGPAMAEGTGLPALILAGMDDKLTKPAAAQELALLLGAGAQFHQLRDCGHMPMVERPAEAAKEINTFINLLPD